MIATTVRVVTAIDWHKTYTAAQVSRPTLDSSDKRVSRVANLLVDNGKRRRIDIFTIIGNANSRYMYFEKAKFLG